MDEKKNSGLTTDENPERAASAQNKTSARSVAKASSTDFGFFGVSATPKTSAPKRSHAANQSAAENAPNESTESSDGKIGGLWESVNTKADRIAADIDDYFTPKYLDTDKKKVLPNKTAYIVIGACTAAFVALAICAYFFVLRFPYYTTGVKVDDFIANFNAITSASDITNILPDYQDVQIPEDAKLGREPVELYGGYITIDADVRFGRIVSLTATAKNLPNYDAETYKFNDDAETKDHFYYYVALGKIVCAYDCAKGNISGFDITECSAYDAANTGFYLHEYARYLGQIGKEAGYQCTVNLDDLDVTYTLPEAQLTIVPTVKTLFGHYGVPETEEDAPAVSTNETSEPTVSDSAVSSSNVQ